MSTTTYLTDIAQHLVTAGHVTGVGTDVFFSWTPETPDVVVTLTPTGGAGAEYVLGSIAPPVRVPGVQIRVRGAANDAAAAFTKAHAIWETLSSVSEEPMNGVTYHSVTPLDMPAYMGRDGNDRPEFVFNCHLVTP